MTGFPKRYVISVHLIEWMHYEYCIAAVQQAWVALRPVRLRTSFWSMPHRVCTVATISKPSTMPLDPSNLQIRDIFNTGSLCCKTYLLIMMHATVAPPDTIAHCLHMLGHYSLGIATPELVPFGIWSHSSRLCPWLYSGILLSAYHLMTSDVTQKLKYLYKWKKSYIFIVKMYISYKN